MIEINYTNTIDEIKVGFLGVYRKYGARRALLFSAVYLIAVILAVDMIAKNPSNFIGYLIAATGGGMIVMQWVRPYLIRDRLINTLSGLSEENYTARFFDDRIEIDTEILQNSETEVIAISKFGVETVENPEVAEAVIAQADNEQPIKPETTVINIATEELYSVDKNDMFCLYVNRGLVYIFPKRCMTDEQITALSGYFTEKAI